MRRPWHTLLAVTALTAPNAALGYSPEPMCAFAPSAPVESFWETPASTSLCLWTPPVGAVRASSDLCAPTLRVDEGGGFRERVTAAQYAMGEARRRLADGHPGEALLHLRVVAAALPEIADHVAMLEGEALEAMAQHDLAAERYYDAADQTPNADVRALARVARARAMLRAFDPKGAKVASELLQRYPELPEASEVRLLLGELRERQGLRGAAVAIYRALDLGQPGFPAAAVAREHLERLREAKTWVPPYTPEQRVARAETLVKTGPVALAHDAVAALSEQKLGEPFAPRVAAMRARLALVEGRFDEARSQAKLSPEASAEPTPLEDERVARLRVRNLLRGRSPDKVIPMHVVLAIDVAARARVTDLTDSLLASLVARADRVPPRLRFEALTLATGAASEEALIALSETLLEQRPYAEAARYHRARALERAGQLELARAAFAELSEHGDDAASFYGILADQRLRALHDEPVSDPCYTIDAPLAHCRTERPGVGAEPSTFGPDVTTALTRLAPIAEAHVEGYPWLTRAEALLRIGESSRAADEIHEAYLAYRSARGFGPLRAGTDAVYRGKAVGRVPRSAQERMARLKLDAPARAELAAVSAALGDYGTAVLLGGRKWTEPLPRPFYDAVEAAARKHGVDPDLLYAVMRVESVYNNRIISYAGAVGLMQIMPRTGRLIANALDHGALTTTDLLRPEVNVEFAAWYLRSLIERMEGRVPLAIASYNGGPHNVRRWIHRFGEHVPLDAFLERIPFSQTHRYVRRVLGYYAQYRAQRGEKLARMRFDLPSAAVDQVGF